MVKIATINAKKNIAMKKYAERKGKPCRQRGDTGFGTKSLLSTHLIPSLQYYTKNEVEKYERN